MIVGSYVLDLYCNNRNIRDGEITDGVHTCLDFPDTYIGKNYNECVKEARSKGWIINSKEDIAICPKCTGNKNE